MTLLLQWLGGGFYLLNKVFLSCSEHTSKNETTARRWRIASWIVYLLGLPPWVIIFIGKHNWIAASVEACGGLTMALGLVMALQRSRQTVSTRLTQSLDYIARIFIVIGFGISLYDFGGITTINQILEIALVTGFLLGTYQLAHKRYSGYLWYVLMHVSCAVLMKIEQNGLLYYMQLVSLIFIIDAYIIAKRKGEQCAVTH